MLLRPLFSNSLSLEVGVGGWVTSFESAFLAETTASVIVNKVKLATMIQSSHLLLAIQAAGIRVVAKLVKNAKAATVRAARPAKIAGSQRESERFDCRRPACGGILVSCHSGPLR
jgi:hypothetical protein